MATKRNVGGETISLSEVLSDLEVQEPVSWHGLQVFPVTGPNGHDPAYVVLDDLLEQGGAEVTEVDDEGAVPTVRVANRSKIDAMLLDGMELKGAKQNRMVNFTVIVGAQSTADVSDMTRSPTSMPSTSGPTALMRPLNSCPSTTGGA